MIDFTEPKERPKKKRKVKVAVEKKKKVEERPEKLFDKVNWKNKVDLYICNQCGYTNEDLDSVKIHIVRHYPDSQKEEILEKLVKE